MTMATTVIETMKNCCRMLLVLTMLLPAMATAEQSKKFGDYTIHYSAFTTDTLTPEVAKQYQIPRSKNRVMVNVTVLKTKNNSPLGTPVKARVTGVAKNLSEQLRDLQVREINEGDAIYYIAETPINNNETLKFSFQITPAGESAPYQLSFEDQFYSD
jgi:hypothetical protein